MDFKSIMQTTSDAVDGTYSEYDDTTTVIIVPVDEHRFQTVYAYKDEINGVTFRTKIGDVTEDTPYKDLMHNNGKLKYSRITIEKRVLYTTAYAFPGFTASQSLSDMLTEVAQTADHWENKLTGQDIN